MGTLLLRVLLVLAALGGCSAAALEPLVRGLPAELGTEAQDDGQLEMRAPEPAARGCRGPKSQKRRQLRVMTLNANSWGSVKRLWEKIQADADVVLLQEVKLRSAAAEAEQVWLRGRGWQLVPSACLSGPLGGEPRPVWRWPCGRASR